MTGAELHVNHYQWLKMLRPKSPLDIFKKIMTAGHECEEHAFGLGEEKGNV